MPILKDKLIENAPPKEKVYFLWDDRTKGLGVKITPKGRKTFVFQWRQLKGSGSKRRTIGKVGDIDLREARRIARQALRTIRSTQLLPQFSGNPSARVEPAGPGSGTKHSVSQPVSTSDLENQLVQYFKKQSSTESQILAAATEVFIHHGFGKRLDYIARKAGVSRVTIYRYFPDKESLVDAVVNEISQSYLRTLPEEWGLDDEQSLHNALLNFAKRFRGSSLSTETLALYRVATKINSHEHIDIFRSVGELSQQRILSALSGYLDKEIRNGNLREVDPQTAAESFLAAVAGFDRARILLGLGGRKGKSLDNYLKIVVDTFIRGLSP